MACDMIVASETAVFGSRVQIGVTAGAGGRKIDENRRKEFIHGDEPHGPQAHGAQLSFGLVNRVVPVSFLSEAKKLAHASPLSRRSRASGEASVLI